MHSNPRESDQATDKGRRINIPQSIQKQFEQRSAIVFRRTIWRQIQIVMGSLIAAFGFTMFQVPFKLAAGGITGLGIIVNHFIAFPVGTIYLLLNIPLLILGYFQLGRWRFVLSTVVAVVCFSFFVDLLNFHLPPALKNWPITDDMLLASIYAGAVSGIGMGLIYRAGGTIGGTSIPARILYERLGFPLSQSFLYSDGAIIVLAGLVFRWEVALLAILTLVLSGIISDLVLEGISQVRTVTIVTKRPEDVRLAIVYQLRRGVSLWSIEGGYSKSPRTMVFCTILRSRVADLKYTIATVDPEAFIVIGVAQQVVGGYGQRLPSSALKIGGNNRRHTVNDHPPINRGG